MTTRIRLTDAQKIQLEVNFVTQLQMQQGVQLPGVKEAVAFFQGLSMSDKRKFDWHALDKSIQHRSYPTKSYSYKYINEAVAAKYANKWPQNIKDTARVMAQEQMAKLQQFNLVHNIQVTQTEMRKQVIDIVYARVSQSKAVIQCPKKVLVDMLRHFLSDDAAVKTMIAPTAIPVLELSESDVLFNLRGQPQPEDKLQVQELQLIAFINLEVSSHTNETYMDFFD
ncbi:Hypothetical_protein [Hexamita inflata]|uniref:Hypothetical_protein n=1 Tax=Hexamita inflata TaxID=28002 RepID=A0AA86QFN9_9EUKA|nr:Hypothetical protein HINF_LOCUS46056 [Hexamita inflata]